MSIGYRERISSASSRRQKERLGTKEIDRKNNGKDECRAELGSFP
jgi:hypothetical protein